MKKRFKIFTVKFRGGDTVEVTAKNRSEAVKAAKANCAGREVIAWEDVTEDRTARYREELYHLTEEPDGLNGNFLSIGAVNYLAMLLEQTGGE